MTRVSGRAQVSGLASTRVPIRVEHLDGTLAALTTAESDGAWAVDVAPGGYRVIEPTQAPYILAVYADPPARPAPTGGDGDDADVARPRRERSISDALARRRERREQA